MPLAIDPPLALDAVKHLYALGVSTATVDIVEFLDHRGLGPVCAGSLRDVLEELADKRELGRVLTSPHHRGRAPEWTTSYFPIYSA